jgi:hypothetical protein
VATFALVSAKGSPGCTTTALALHTVWPDVSTERRILLAECDPAGGDIASGYLAGSLASGRGLLPLAVSRIADPVAAIWEHTLSLDDDGRRLLLPGVLDARRAGSLTQAWSTLQLGLPQLAHQDPPVDVLLDLGRVGTQHESPKLRSSADRVVLVTRATLTAVAAARPLAEELQTESAPCSCLVIGAGEPYSAIEVAESLGLPLLGSLPLDRAAADAFTGRRAMAPRRLSSTSLVRAARQLTSRLLSAVPAGWTPAVAGAPRG